MLSHEFEDTRSRLQATIDMLKNSSVLDRKEKHEFLENVFAIFSHSSKEPVAALSRILIESVKGFLLQSILDKDSGGPSDKIDTRNTG